VYPTLDMAGHYPSHDALRDGYFLTMRKMQWFNDHYVGSAQDAEDPCASPMRAGSHAGLPPALIISAELDPLVDEAAAYAAKLEAAGVAVEYRSLLGWPHGFMYWAHTEAYRQALEQLAVAFRRAFGT
jgi:acetyl esterase